MLREALKVQIESVTDDEARQLVPTSSRCSTCSASLDMMVELFMQTFTYACMLTLRSITRHYVALYKPDITLQHMISHSTMRQHITLNCNTCCHVAIHNTMERYMI